jgi:Arc/MetJ family transcription regulator
MKRTNVVLDEALLEEAVRTSGERTYSRTITRALEEMVRRAKARQIDRLAGSGLWSGDLGEMRADAPVAREGRGVYRTRRRRAAR